MIVDGGRDFTTPGAFGTHVILAGDTRLFLFLFFSFCELWVCPTTTTAKLIGAGGADTRRQSTLTTEHLVSGCCSRIKSWDCGAKRSSEQNSKFPRRCDQIDVLQIQPNQHASLDKATRPVFHTHPMPKDTMAAQSRAHRRHNRLHEELLETSHVPGQLRKVSCNKRKEKQERAEEYVNSELLKRILQLAKEQQDEIAEERAAATAIGADAFLGDGRRADEVPSVVGSGGERRVRVRGRWLRGLRRRRGGRRGGGPHRRR